MTAIQTQEVGCLKLGIGNASRIDLRSSNERRWKIRDGGSVLGYLSFLFDGDRVDLKRWGGRRGDCVGSEEEDKVNESE